jgi:1-acyl-sn-glycerol-3-phosphate acyltransferase
MSRGFRFMHDVLRWLRIVDFDPRPAHREIPSFPSVIVANHPTLMDISALLATEKDLVFPVKPGLFRSFWARPLLSGAEHFEGAGQDRLSVGRMIDEAVDRIANGHRVIIFPEGTRSPRRDLHPFGRAAFEIALRAGVPIVPIVITCHPPWLTKDIGFFDSPPSLPTLRLRALPPLRPERTGSSSRTTRDIVESRIRDELGLKNEPAECRHASKTTPAEGNDARIA